MFVGREKELHFLEERYASAGGELIVVYGRRRVGKTETLRKFCEGKPHVFYSCTESPDGQQLAAFSERVLRLGGPAAKYVTTFSSWMQAFENIADLGREGKAVIVIDEFPYMVKGNGAIPSILQNVWDEKLKNANVMLVLCGSSMSFIEKEILAEKNPLYGRATGILKLREMGFYDAVRFLPDYSPEDKVTAYAVLGGIPHYLKQFDGKSSLKENICRHILTRGSILYSEVEFLMRQELRETAVYNTIIEAVALGNTKLNDVYQKTQMEKTKLSVYLKNLVELGILRREFSVDSGVKEQANVQRGLYRLTDNFFRFWFAFVFPNLSELEAGDVEGIWRYAVEPELDRYTSYAFEEVCRQYLRRENTEDRLPFHFTKIGRWWNKTDEIDIMAVDQKRESFLLGECKYKNSPLDLSDLRELQRKFTPGRENSRVWHWLFSRSGFTAGVREAASAQDVRLVTVEELAE